MSIKDLFQNAKSIYQKEKEEDIKKRYTELNVLRSKNNSYKFHRSRIINSIIFTLLTTIACTTILHYISNSLIELQQEFNREQFSMQSTYIVYVKNYLDASCSSQLKDISHAITDEIYETMDIRSLQKSLSKGEVPPELEKIFRENIMDVCTVPGLDDQTNNIFICNSTGILADYSQVYATSGDKTRTWEIESESQENKKLFNNTIDQMFKQDSSYMLVEERVIKDGENHEVLTKMTQKEIIDIFNREGLDGLSNYTFLVPVYVMNNNDIFGVADIVGGKRITNNKFVIVQRYNLYDYIKNHNLDAQVNTKLMYEFKHFSFMFNLFIIIFIIMTLIKIIYDISILNHAVQEQEKACSEKLRNTIGSMNNIGSEIATAENCGRRNYGRRASDRYVAEILAMAEQERRKKEEEKESNSSQDK